jgi:hypothetical protein
VQLLKDTGANTNDPCNSTPNPLRVDALAAFQAVEGDPGTPYCFGDGGGANCPCGNASAAGDCEGCANSAGGGSRAGTSGSASLTADDLEVAADGMLPTQPALLFVGESSLGGGDGVAFGDGLQCAGTNIIRLGVEIPDGAGTASWGPGLSVPAGWTPGDLRFLQVWYRDPSASPCGSGFNLSNGIEILLTL